jgi:glycosyltransferase involved in cell wall biosynthesis
MNDAELQRPGEPPLVSILIPAFNHEAFVERCLDSVLEDRYPAKELIVVDDGSADRTPEIIERWVDAHRGDLPIQFVRNGHKGIAATLNELAVRAKGQFLRPGASDDYLLPGGLDALVGYLLDHPAKGAVIGDSIVVDSSNRKLHDSGMRDLHGANKNHYRSDDGIRRAIIGEWAVGGPVALIRKSALETVDRWTEGLRIDDWDLFLRLAAQNMLGFVDVKVCAYRLHGANLSKTRNEAARIANLAESQQIALRRLRHFEEPYRTLLYAQSHYIGAKIAFLERRPAHLLMQMLAFFALNAAAKLGVPTSRPSAQKA